MDYELSEEDRKSLESDIEEFVSDERLINFLSTIFKAMGDPTRLKIIFLLSKSPLRVNEISELLNMSQSSISHQLAILRNQELIKVKRIGRYAIYSLDDEHVLRLFNEGYNHAEHKKRN
ncbi:transcriptional regulator, ArsR family [Anaerosphaera aminiphila DSM 21120]|uniref:Transcriptional regulator, ArsR family n=1 Tax=Anaerosphaera aminiphila DSM 21120 TaxID=1120995 RepID=A0A1M5TBJ3_9FIRM|nr:metalloregulator ArsR/SmtB family transcription factor [Anaerosphaera aminiphila]SHH48061.1 transcriptional regulator, ArsR family [Anaerosphaera aminiphila DSM 21120]